MGGMDGGVKKLLLIVGAVVVVAGVVVGIWWWNQVPDVTGGDGETLYTKPSATPLEEVEVQLFFADAMAWNLVPTPAEIVATGDVASEAEATLRKLLQGPAEEDEGLLASVPDGVTLRGLYMDGQGTAFVDLGSVPPLLGGMRSEMLLAYGITDTLAYSFPADVRRVRLLIDGQEADTLAGHLAIDVPLLPRRDLVNTLGER